MREGGFVMDSSLHDIPIKEFKMICPNCGSGQFTILPITDSLLQIDLPGGVLGLSECRGCSSDFYVSMPVPVKRNFYAILIELCLHSENISNIFYRIDRWFKSAK